MAYSTNTNLYAAKVYAENPLALWPLDDDFSFISSISQSDKDIANWDFYNGNTASVGSSSVVSRIPFPNEALSGFARNSGSNYVTYLIPFTGINTNSLDPEKTTICINANVWKISPLVDKYRIGFQYVSGSATVTDVNTINPLTTSSGWQKISHTFSYPASATIYPYLEVEFLEGGSDNEYDIFVNALSVGQWSEKFHSETTGIIPPSLPSSVGFYSLLPTPSGSIQYSVIDSYGLTTADDGYYLVDNKKMLAVNNGMPMVFGAANITNLYPPVTPNMPSIVIPGKGFLNRKGQYSQLTAEFWLRIYNESQTPKRIFGPLSSTDGLYVEEEFLTLRVGRYSKSYFIGKWYRPMLIDIRYTPTDVSLLINGLNVMTMDIVADDVQFPLVNRDWLGFYAHEEAQPFEIDCVAIYPYFVSDQLAKRRFIYGQGVESPDIISSNFGGDSAFIDFAFSKYSSDFEFPTRVAWGAGSFSNLETNSQQLTFPKYELPELKIFGNDLSIFTLTTKPRTWSEVDDQIWDYWQINGSWEEVRLASAADLLVDSFFAQNGDPYPFITMRPNAIYNDIHPTLFFESANVITNPLSSMFGVFGTSASVQAGKQTILHIRNKTTQQYFEIYQNSASLVYAFNDTILNVENLSASSRFIAGIDIDKISRQFRRIVENFFGVPQNLSINLGGYETETFTGKIYSFTFNNRLFTDKDLGNYFSSLGFATTSASANPAIVQNDNYIMKYVGNYSLLPLRTSSAIQLDIGCSGYWESAIPLSALGKNTILSSGQTFYDLDSMQFNIDFPSPIIVEQGPPHDEDDTRLKSYVTLQDFRRVGSIPYTNWINTEPIASNRVIDFDNTVDVIQTKYEVVDGTVIFPPKELIDFRDYYVMIHLEMSTRGIETMPVKLQRMGLSSLSFDESGFYPIGTKTGKDIFPFTRYANNYAPKEKNPFTIYKGSTPYLYLTSDSGISVLDYPTNSTARGLSLPINQNKAPEFSLGGIQMWTFFKESETIDDIKTIAAVNTPDLKLEFRLIPETNGKRAKMIIFNATTGTEFTDVQFYQNGNLVDFPHIQPMEWASIVVSLGTSININAISGQFELYHGMLYNNIAFLEKQTDVFSTIVDSRAWSELLSDPVIGPLAWGFWNSYSWEEVANLTTTQLFTINGIEIFNSYLGLAKAVVVDDTSIMLNSEQLQQFVNVSWSEFSGKPV
jgi:hypothetical protein